MMDRILFNVATTVGPLILAIAVHEWAHVAMARFLGDRTGERMGRFTLNPLAHIDPLWTVAIPIYFVVTATLGGAGWAVPFFGAGKPAPYNPVQLDRTFNGKRITMAHGELLVAAAGPLSNLVLALLTTGILIVLVRAGQPLDGSDPSSFALPVFSFVVLNVGLALFNLIPVPPLDGSKILFSVLPRVIAQRYIAICDGLSWVLLLAVFVGARHVLAPIQDVIVDALVAVVAAASR